MATMIFNETPAVLWFQGKSPSPLLKGMGTLRSPDPLQCDNLLSVGLEGQGQTGIDRFSVKKDCTCTAISLATPLLDLRMAQSLSKEMKKGLVKLRV